MKNVTLGYARADERGEYRGGHAGDQTGQEVYLHPWYSHPWHTVFRPQPGYGPLIANAMKAACENDHIGYDQKNRLSLFVLAKLCGWDIKGIRVPCETDCSALVSVCLNAAGIRVPASMYTGNEKENLEKTGCFTVFTAPEYTLSPELLQPGDILLGDGHTAIVVQAEESA